MEYQPNKRIWKSYVWYEEKCFFVSTIERDYSTIEGPSRGQETLVWSYNWEMRERGDKILYQGGGVSDHFAVCCILMKYGEIPNEDDERWNRICN